MADAYSFNQVILTGRIPKAVTFDWTKPKENEEKPTRRGLARFQVVTNEIYGDKPPRAEYHNCVTFGKNAELMRDYAYKGLLLTIRGRLQHQRYKDKEGNWKNWTQVRAEQIIFLSKKEGVPAPTEEEPEKQEEQEEHEQDPY